ncbi:hypothetical protein ACGF0D_11355 [Kitasatospora sp. NPDC048298]|uniref:hypothetical protein n=1 Tax=Kitasatospora sp. NPDC048298 TaxID=3364049 RepID=UPI003724956A
MYEQPPPQVPPIDRTVGYDADLKVVKEVADIDPSPQGSMSSLSVNLGFIAGPEPSEAVTNPAREGAGTDTKPVTQIMDGPGGLYGPSFADPAPWVCDGAPTPGCMPAPPPVIGGFI